MADDGIKQRLAAVLAADVAGYSRLMGDDERATVAALDASRDIFRDQVGGHGGRVVDTAGDSVLAVFELATAAVAAALAIQEALAERNAPQPEARRMRFRIGIHIGEVLSKPDGSIYGDGVNIAARLEAIADAGGICVSDMAHGAVRGRIDKRFDDLGEHEVKNIAEPVRAYRLVLSAEPRGAPMRRLPLALAAAVAALGVVVAGAWWWLHSEPDAEAPPRAERSIAVLPFSNMSGEAEQEYFADGISEDLITELSRFEGLLVIARNSSFRFKGQAVDVTEVAKALGVRYVLEGGVRRTGERVRITAQLIDADTGGHLWAERYDRELTDVFAVQDDVTRQIIAALQAELGGLTPTRGFKQLTENHEAYDLFLRARVEKERRTEAASVRAHDLLNQAIALDPAFAAAYAELSDAQHLAVYYGWDVPAATLDAAMRNAEKAVALEGSLPLAHAQLGRRLYMMKQFEQSAASLNRAIALDTNYAIGYTALAALYTFTGEYTLALGMADKASRLDPYAVRPLLYKGMTAFAQEDYDEAIAVLKEGVDRNPNFSMAYQWLTAAHALAGNDDEARAAAANVLRISPKFYEGLTRFPFTDPSVLPRLFEGLRKAGLDAPDPPSPE
jgi:adenylate cyclase